MASGKLAPRSGRKTGDPQGAGDWLRPLRRLTSRPCSTRNTPRSGLGCRSTGNNHSSCVLLHIRFTPFRPTERSSAGLSRSVGRKEGREKHAIILPLLPENDMRNIAASLVFTVGFCFSIATIAQQPAADDKVWTDFVTWLQVLPPSPGVVSVLQQYSKELARKGAPPEEAKATLDRVVRLMRERPEAWRPMFNRIYATDTATTFSTEPTPLLVNAVDGLTPGRALDVGMGQGRNAVFLALKGWDVTGFDLSEEGLAAASAQATRAGVPLKALQADAASFDYGREAWDLIVITYGPAFVAEPAFAGRLKSALRPGGLLVIESFASDSTAPSRRAVDLDPAELIRQFQGYRLIRFEDVDGKSEWEPQVTRLVRLIARKPS